jgi:hypothetical protein
MPYDGRKEGGSLIVESRRGVLWHGSSNARVRELDHHRSSDKSE